MGWLKFVIKLLRFSLCHIL